MSSKPLKKILSPLSSLLPIEKLGSSTVRRMVFPFWHAVSDTPPAHLSQLYRVSSVAAFERDLDFFLKNYRSATVGEVCRSAQSGEKTDRLFFPSFDDGMTECYQVIAPLLKRKGIQAAFFINPSFVDNKTLFHRHKSSLILETLQRHPPTPEQVKEAEWLVIQGNQATNLHQFLHRAVYTDHAVLDQVASVFGIDFNQYLISNQPYMTMAQIREIQADGFLIGAHSMDHREFFRSTEEEIYAQITESMNFLVRELNPEIKTFAFPFTDFGVPDAVFEKARQSGIVDLSFGTAGIKDETMPGHIQRIPMESEISRDGKQVLRTEYIWYYLKTLWGKNKVRRQ